MKTSCIVYIETYTIILGLQFSIVVQQNFINFSHNYSKFSQIFLKLSLIVFNVFKFSNIFQIFKIVKTFCKAAQKFAKFFKFNNNFLKFVFYVAKILKLFLCYEDPKSLRLYTYEITNYNNKNFHFTSFYKIFMTEFCPFPLPYKNLVMNSI